MIKRLVLFLVLLFCASLSASHKVYILHGYGGFATQMINIQEAMNENGNVSEIFSYRSMAMDIDSISKILFDKIKTENYDSISFVTHSMGGLVVRSLYNHLVSSVNFPFIYRFVMIAPPNKGSPVADYFAKFKLARKIGGPNLLNLTTHKEDGAAKYPIPNCEVGLIVGISDKKSGYTSLIEGDNDGMVQSEQTKLGIEQDVIYVKSTHMNILFHDDVQKFVANFIRNGRFHQ